MTKLSRDKGSDLSAGPGARSLPWWFHQFSTPLLVLIAGLILIFAIGFAQRVGWISAGGVLPSPAAGGTEAIYTCPMHPQIRQPGPERCPICGMELVPAAPPSGTELDDFAVRIEPAQRRLANIQTADVEYEAVVSTINTVGSIAVDESRMATIASYIDGRIERIFADYTGVQVAKGDHLAVVYSQQYHYYRFFCCNGCLYQFYLV